MIAFDLVWPSFGTSLIFKSMTFWESIRQLRKRGTIPRQWRVADIQPHLAARFSQNTIGTVPANQSVSKDGKEKGDYVLRRGREPEAFRLGDGLYDETCCRYRLNLLAGAD